VHALPPLPRSALLLTNQLTTGGAEIYVLTMSRWLAEHGVRTVVAATPGELVDRLDPKVCYYPTELQDLRLSIPLAVARVRRILRAHQPEVIVANSLVTAWVARLAALPSRTPIVAVAHGWAAERYRLISAPLAVADRVVPVSQEVARRLTSAGLPASKVQVIANGVDLSPFGPRTPSQRQAARDTLGATDDDVVVTSVGRFVEQKQQHRIVEIAARLRDELPELKFAIIGWGPLEGALRAQIDRAGLNDTVRLLLRRTDVPDLLLASDLYLCTSDWEGMPLSMIEAMAAGLPIVSTDVEGMSALVRPENGLLCAPTDLPGLTAAVRLLGADEVGRLHRGSHSRALAEREFSKEVMCRRLGALLGELAGAR
jgi:glycosyltransferase involved in cell wall biosynthesis